MSIVSRVVQSSGTSTTDATAEQWHIKSGKTAYIASGKVTGNAYTPAMMSFGATGYMSIASEEWLFTNGITAVGRFVKSSHLNAGGVNRALFYGVTSTAVALQITTTSSDVGGDRDQTLGFFIQNTTPATLVNVATASQVTNGTLHNFLFSYNPTTAALHLYLDDVSDLDTGDSAHLITTGSIASGAGSKYYGSRSTPDRYWGGSGGHAGMFGIANVFIDFSVEANRRKFFRADGSPVAVNEGTWAAFGGVTPYAWNPYGDLRDNRGSGSDFAQTNSIVVSDFGAT